MNYKILINKKNKLDKNSIQNRKLITCTNIYGEKIEIEKKTYSMYLELKDFLSEKKIYIGIDNAYRNEVEQEEIYTKFLKEYGEDYARKYAAFPLHSEHESGLAIDIDICIDGVYYDMNQNNDNLFLGENKKYLDKFIEISNYLHNFGFILRYPKGREDITGYHYEPWHIRYVGKKTATIIYNENITLEEYYKKYNLNGVLVVNKPSGMTSRDVCNIISKYTDTKKVGHTGTLDPLAEGVLVVTLGKYTKFGEDLTALDKEYIAKVKVGIETDTLDITGKIIRKKIAFSLDRLEQVVKSFEKTYIQEVPIYSAVKVNGKKMYEYARNNIDINLPSKKVTIKKIELLDKTKDTFTFKCIVSKGTYIRSLIRDIAKEMDIPMTMTELTRTRQGKFVLSESNSIDAIKNNKYKLLTIDDIFSYPKIEVDINTKNKILNGVRLSNNYNVIDKVIFTYQNKNLAIYRNNNNSLEMYKLL